MQPNCNTTDPNKACIFSRYLPLCVILCVAAVFRLWNLSDTGVGNLYYAAAAKSMGETWSNFLYGAFDPAGFVTLDKPPFAIWVQVAFTKVLGFNWAGLHLPQVIEGLLAILLTYFITRSAIQGKSGHVAALIAAAIVAVNPANVTIDRSNLPDSCLLLVLLCAGVALLSAISHASFKRLSLCMVLVGIGFGIKMIAAFLVLPVFYGLYLICAPIRIRCRLLHLSAATVLVFGVSLAWPVMVDFTPAHMRPYVGDTSNNSAISLAFGMFGFDRFTGKSQPPMQQTSDADTLESALLQGALQPPNGPMNEPFTAQGGRPGPLRLINRDMIGYISWFTPLTIVGFLIYIRTTLAKSTIRSSLQTCETQVVLFWAMWLGVHAVVFSLSNSPIHPYYLNMLSPAIGGLVGICIVHGIQHMQSAAITRFMLIAGILLTALWNAHIVFHYSDWAIWCMPIIAVACMISLAGLTIPKLAQNHEISLKLVTAGVFMLLITPALWASTAIIESGGRMVPIADPELLDYRVDPQLNITNRQAVNKLVSFLKSDLQSQAIKPYLLTVQNIHFAAPIIVETGDAVMPYGGFTGTDPILTVEAFEDLVECGKIRYVLLAAADRENQHGSQMIKQGGPQSPHSPQKPDLIAQWVKANSTTVPDDKWRDLSDSPQDTAPRNAPWGQTAMMIYDMLSNPNVLLYDCKPQAK